RVAPLLKGAELLERLLSQKGGGLTVKGAVFSKVEPAVSLKHDLIQSCRQLPETLLVSCGHRKIQGQRVAVHRMSHQEPIRPMPLQNTQVGDDSPLLTGLYLAGKTLFRSLFWNKTLVLDQSARPISELPVRHIVQQKGKASMGLPHGLMVAQGSACEI